MELLQASVPSRVSSLKDLTLNTAGSLAGAALGSAWHLLSARMAPASSGQARSRSVGIAILVLWFLSRLWPLVPDVGLRQLKAAVHPLITPHVELADLAVYFVGWLVVAQAVFNLAKRQRSVDTFLVVIAVVLVGRTITLGNTLVTAELAAIALLLPVLVMLSRLGDGTRAMLVAVVLGTWLAWTAVGPVLGRGMQPAAALPALQEFIGRNPPPPAELAEKGFDYLSLAWLLAVAGLLPHVAAGITILFVLIIALLQLGAPLPDVGWVDVAVAAIAGILVVRWIPK
jgi:hypothetical protein